MTPSNTATVRGTVHAIGETQTFGAKGLGFRKRQIIVDATKAGARRPAYVVATLVRDGIEWGDTIRSGDPVEMIVEITGREWQGRWFADVEVVDGWTLEQAAPPEPQPVRYEPTPAPRQAPLPTKASELDDRDDVPFD